MEGVKDTWLNTNNSPADFDIESVKNQLKRSSGLWPQVAYTILRSTSAVLLGLD